jgi:hypothetical protein
MKSNLKKSKKNFKSKSSWKSTKEFKQGEDKSDGECLQSTNGLWGDWGQGKGDIITHAYSLAHLKAKL